MSGATGCLVFCEPPSLSRTSLSSFRCRGLCFSSLSRDWLLIYCASRSRRLPPFAGSRLPGLAARCRARLLLPYRRWAIPIPRFDESSSLISNCADLNIPPSQILVEGDSAGGHLALQLLMYLRDAGLPQIAGGLLLSPWVDMSSSFASWDENRVRCAWIECRSGCADGCTRTQLIDYLALDDPHDPLRPSRLYLTGTDSSKETAYRDLLAHPYVSPSLAPLSSLSSLPPLLIQGAGLECLRDEDTVLARRLRKAGNEKVTHQVWMDGVHVFQLLQADRAGKEAMKSLAGWVVSSFGSAEAEARGKEWTQKPLELLKAEREARIARVGHLAMSKPAAPHGFKWEKTVERLADVGVKKEGVIEAAKRAADEANAVPDDLAQSEVYRPVWA